jgi:hypothetical protein
LKLRLLSCIQESQSSTFPFRLVSGPPCLGDIAKFSNNFLDLVENLNS